MFDIDRVTIDLACPVCGFCTPALYRQARLRAPLVCRGCHRTIQLDDHMNECKKARQSIARAVADLEASLSKLNMNLAIRL